MDSANLGPDLRRGVSFGPFRLYAAERVLEKDGSAVPLGSRALDLLTVLIENAGEVVGKDELLARGWPKLTVDESSLRFQIAGLRRVLGRGASGVRYVENVHGRGYCFVAPIAPIAPVEQAQRISFDTNLGTPPQDVTPVRALMTALGFLDEEPNEAPSQRSIGAGLAPAPVGSTAAAMAQAKREVECRNKAIVLAGFQAWRAGTGSPFELLADDATWTMGEQSAVAETYASRAAFITDVTRPFAARTRFAAKPELRGIYADGDVVIVLFNVVGGRHDDGSHTRAHVWLLEMQGERVARAWAFRDNLPSNDLWVGLGHERRRASSPPHRFRPRANRAIKESRDLL